MFVAAYLSAVFAMCAAVAIITYACIAHDYRNSLNNKRLIILPYKEIIKYYNLFPDLHSVEPEDYLIYLGEPSLIITPNSYFGSLRLRHFIKKVKAQKNMQKVNAATEAYYKDILFNIQAVQRANQVTIDEAVKNISALSQFPASDPIAQYFAEKDAARD